MVWDVIAGIGSIVGLITGIFVAWDRLSRKWPIFLLEARKFSKHGDTRWLVLRAINRDNRPMLIHISPNQPKDHLVIRLDQSTKSIVSAVSGVGSRIVVDGNSEEVVGLAYQQRLDELPADYTFKVHFRWRFVQPIISFISIPRTICISKEDAGDLLSGTRYLTEN